MVVLSLPLGLVAACGSDDQSSTTQTSATQTPAADPVDCPFSGTTAPTQGGEAAKAVLSDVTSSKSGCIDSLAFDFSGPPPAWNVQYAAGPFVDTGSNTTVSVPGPATLVVTFASTTYAKHATPAKAPTNDLDYVNAIDVISGPNGSLQWIISVTAHTQYQTSLSEVPSSFILGIG